LVVAAGLVAAAGAQTAGTQAPPPSPKPFPGAATPPASATTKPDPARPQAPTIADLGQASVMPNAEFLDSFDAGQGQKYLIYGTNMPYDQVVTYYKASLRGAGNRELFTAPAMYQFDLGRFDERTMAYPPSVVVKDYTANGSEGYLHVAGTLEKRYRTIIQIVPAPPAGPGR
jgi:hypothetical protein